VVVEDQAVEVGVVPVAFDGVLGRPPVVDEQGPKGALAEDDAFDDLGSAPTPTGSAEDVDGGSASAGRALAESLACQASGSTFHWSGESGQKFQFAGKSVVVWRLCCLSCACSHGYGQSGTWFAR
jgi:hypothetical protein